jgi:hypothetical protein
MKRLLATSLVAGLAALALPAAPALAQLPPEAKTELIDLGANVGKMQLRYDFDAGWVVDNQNILYRDYHRDYYLVTLKAPCEPLDIRRRKFKFHPSWAWMLEETRAYEVRAEGAPYCDVAKIEKIDDARANTLRETSKWRVW